jgi:hypothetical protein
MGTAKLLQKPGFRIFNDDPDDVLHIHVERLHAECCRRKIATSVALCQPAMRRSATRNVSYRIAGNASGEVVGLNWSANSEKERPIPRIGPLFASIKPVADPNPSFTKTVEPAVRAFAQGDAAVRTLQQLTPGARTDLAAGSARAFAGVRGLAYLSAQDVSGRGIERHGGAVSRVLFYRMETDRGRRWLMVHVTSDNLITDYDVVDESE